LHKVLHVVDAMQALIDTPSIIKRDLMSRRKLLYVILERGGSRYTSGRGMRLFQKAGIGQVRHDIANACRTETFAVGPRQSARSNRFPTNNVGLDDRRKYFPFAGAELRLVWHTL